MAAKDLLGRVCVKLAGRDAGAKGVVVSVKEDGAVVLTGPKSLTGLRRRKVNVKHLVPTPRKVEIREDATDDEVLEAIKKAGLENYMVERYEA
ncbi:MAG: 50S ribosomal protein L14e [Candidatus Caldarchaeum sp.]|nr:50S ribosomal protein L14e [Candidatus Caldarchaeum sp.]MDW8360263.1 50S ribosomal protein L14e [Candidatus Caldarchaeum sp.]